MSKDKRHNSEPQAPAAPEQPATPVQGPDGKRPPVDLPAAKDAIDLLGILQEKTKGNLTKEEEEILREGLYHLRMGYMAMINPPPPGRGKEGNQR